MQFKVQGIVSGCGQTQELLIEAPDESAALSLAEARGLMKPTIVPSVPPDDVLIPQEIQGRRTDDPPPPISWRKRLMPWKYAAIMAAFMLPLMFYASLLDLAYPPVLTPCVVAFLFSLQIMRSCVSIQWPPFENEASMTKLLFLTLAMFVILLALFIIGVQEGKSLARQEHRMQNIKIEVRP